MKEKKENNIRCQVETRWTKRNLMAIYQETPRSLIRVPENAAWRRNPKNSVDPHIDHSGRDMLRGKREIMVRYSG